MLFLLFASYIHSSTDKPLIPPHLASAYLSWKELIPPSSSVSALVLRSSSSCVQRLPRPRTEVFRRSPFYYAMSVLNAILPAQSSTFPSVRSFFLS